jgi:hypothetical protein
VCPSRDSSVSTSTKIKRSPFRFRRGHWASVRHGDLPEPGSRQTPSTGHQSKAQLTTHILLLSKVMTEGTMSNFRHKSYLRKKLQPFISLKFKQICPNGIRIQRTNLKN